MQTEVREQSTASGPIRVTIQQPSLARYRVPVYRHLADRQGISLTVLYGKEPTVPNVDPEGFDAQFRRQLKLGSFRWFRSHFDAVSRDRSDVAVLGANIRHLSLMPAIRLARRRRVGVVLWGHGYSKRSGGAWDRLRVNALKLADAVLLYNNRTVPRLTAAGIDPARVFVALNSLDQDPIRAARDAVLADPDALRCFQQDRGINPRTTILFVSRFEPANRVDLLLHAADRLRREFPDLRVLIVGKGEDEPRLRALHAELGLGEIVRFLGPIYEEAQLAPLYCSSRLFCYPANIGLSILHAFGYGLPVVTADRLEEQNPEIEAIDHGRNGLLYSADSLDALTDALRRLFEDDELHAACAAGARATVEDRFNIQRMVDGIEAAVRFAHHSAAARSH